MLPVLIIDDDKDICLVLSRFLSKNNYEVDVANNGEEGLKQLRAKEYTLVLCDYRLPDMTGVDALRKIKLLRPQTAVIIITGYSDVKTAVETFRYGASDFVTKPLYPDELLVTIRETIAKTQSKGQSLAAEGSKTERKSSNGKLSTEDFIVGKSSHSQTVQRHVELI